MKINETWNDGACRRCKCYASKPSLGFPGSLENLFFHNSTQLLVVFLDKPHASCSIETCDNSQTRKNQEKYVMEAQNVEDVCCPEYKKIACREGDSVYQVHFIHQSSMS